MQFGAFSPVARIHCSTKVHRYPWGYDAAVEKIVGDFFRLRYRLLPMLYAAAYAAHRAGTPLMRRCDLEWPQIPEAAESTQYLLGDDLLVAPITGPADKAGNAERTVWIPEGEWQDLWTGRIHHGPATIGISCSLGEYPVFARRGGLVLSSPQRQSTGAAIWPDLVVDGFVPSRDQVQKRLLYEDDGESTAYERGEYAVTEFSLRQFGNETEVMIASPTPPRGIGPAQRNTTLRIHLLPGARVRSVRRDDHVLEPRAYVILPSSGQNSEQLFAGAGCPPPVEAGPVLEWRGAIDAGKGMRFQVACTDS
jgi:alpha-glucosidase (family GH31 glycosyl hydrolase)